MNPLCSLATCGRPVCFLCLLPYFSHNASPLLSLCSLAHFTITVIKTDKRHEKITGVKVSVFFAPYSNVESRCCKTHLLTTLYLTVIFIQMQSQH